MHSRSLTDTITARGIVVGNDRGSIIPYSVALFTFGSERAFCSNNEWFRDAIKIPITNESRRFPVAPPPSGLSSMKIKFTFPQKHLSDNRVSRRRGVIVYGSAEWNIQIPQTVGDNVLLISVDDYYDRGCLRVQHVSHRRRRSFTTEPKRSFLNRLNVGTFVFSIRFSTCPGS